MAEAIPKKVILGEARPLVPSLGRQLLNIITAGMYSDPCMVVREYIQNAADSIDHAIDGGILPPSEALIQIALDGAKRNLIIQDNGSGVPNKELEDRLGGLGKSPKEGLGLRGFRGIGRLGGLAYCAVLRFETRANAQEPVGVVEWDSNQLKTAIGKSNRSETIQEAVSRVARIYSRPATANDPSHFFRVSLEGVLKFHSDKLMNVSDLSAYISRVAPVPFDRHAFSHAHDVSNFLENLPSYRTYRIEVAGEQVFSPYCDDFSVSGMKTDHIYDIDYIEFKSVAGEAFGKGWLARTRLLGSLPKAFIMRGISVRQGNIEVGDEDFLRSIFTEPRFATWCIGAIHFDHSVRPNARRDGFEVSPNYERFLEQASVLGRQLSKAARQFSKDRCAQQNITRRLAEMERTLDSGVFIDPAHLQEIASRTEKALSSLQKGTSSPDPSYGPLRNRAARLRNRLASVGTEALFLPDLLDGRSLSRVSQKELLQMVCRAAFRTIGNDDTRRKLLLEVLSPYLKQAALQRQMVPLTFS